LLAVLRGANGNKHEHEHEHEERCPANVVQLNTLMAVAPMLTDAAVSRLGPSADNSTAAQAARPSRWAHTSGAKGADAAPVAFPATPRSLPQPHKPTEPQRGARPRSSTLAVAPATGPFRKTA